MLEITLFNLVNVNNMMILQTACHKFLKDMNPRLKIKINKAKKVSLQPGETKTVSLTVRPQDLAYFDVSGHQWKADAGEYEVDLGASARDIRQKAKFWLTADFSDPISPTN